MQLVKQAWERIISILRILDEEGELSIYAIAERLGERRQTVSSYLMLMEQLGLVTITLEKTVPPRKIITLTEKGKCMLSCASK